ncbi:DUF2971 domain-containing protein [Streptomyces massasporeus]|uniref:DUF2971 domain-containing protein n=1 Tax=Streptomyces massasporeus TaxID=67324 RepID=UPI0033B76B0A
MRETELIGLERDWLLREVDEEMGDIRPKEPLVRPERVYHYTTAAGLHGIISSSSFWASDVEFLNDAQELVYARDRLLNALALELNDAGLRVLAESGQGSWHSESWRQEVALGLQERDAVRDRVRTHRPSADEASAFSALHVVVSDLGKVASSVEPSTLRVYTTCFCEDGDLLSQWRAYGGAGGYAIGFRTDELVHLSESVDECRFDKVSYGFREAIGRGWLPEYIQANLALDDYLNALTMVKHPAFREEQEWRLMLAGRRGGTGLSFRVSPVGLVPYVSLPFSGNAIDKVIVGPGQYSAERAKGVRRLLDSLKMFHVSVEVSLSPLRS